MTGPLHRLRVLELGGIGPAPFAGMLLADLGAESVRVDRVDAATRPGPVPAHPLDRGRRSVAIDLTRPDGAAAVLRLAAAADVLLEGFRPGVAERLGIGPERCRAVNRRLVYGRMTGWGQRGPLAGTAGHDINYVALAGVLAHIGGRDAPPTPPLNLVGDFGGGGMLLAVGVLAALIERAVSGAGQVVDAAMIDGSALQMTMVRGMHAAGGWLLTREANLLDGGAPFYRTYQTSDGRYVAVGALEEKFYARLLQVLGLSDVPVHRQGERADWPALTERMAAVFRSRTRDQWCAAFAGAETCFAPVLDLAEAPGHPHHLARGTFVQIDGVTQAAPAPRLDRTPAGLPDRPPDPGEHSVQVLTDWGLPAEEVDGLCARGTVVQRVVADR